MTRVNLALMTVALSVLVTAGGSLAFHGRVGVDFLVTGFVASALTYLVVDRLTYPLRAALKQSREDLERRVDARTSELSAALHALETAHAETNALQLRMRMSERITGTGAFASAVSHEIRNPLSATLGNLELMVEMLEEGADRDELLETARDALLGARQVHTVVGDLSTLSPAKHQVATTEVAEIAGSAVRLAAHVTRRTAEVRVEVPPGLRAAIAPPRLLQVVINLVVNAAHATRPGAANLIVVSAAERDGGVEVSVADQGVGIPADQQDKVFEPHFTTKGEEGTGLGLAIVRQIAEAAGGRASLSSVEGEGTTVRVWLPAAHS
ncbi:MAG: HAMP domain-containing histidine kinase [Alphaproteobacteria bacterium]|nr:HAMP domain-containing histidine kinase [Alphaproteobacteria bacterium]